MPKNEKQALLDALENDDYDAFMEEKRERIRREEPKRKEKEVPVRVDKRRLYE